MPDTLPFADVLAAVPMPMVIIGQDARIEGLNPEARALLGEVEGRLFLTAIRQPEPVSLIERVLAGGEGGAVRWRLTGPGQDTIFRGRVAALAGIGASLVFEDISDAEQLVDMRREFVSNVSHELRTPLTALLGFIETLQGAARDDPSARTRFLGIMQREALRMNRLVGDLLSLSRVEAQERVRPQALVDMVALAQSVLPTLRGMADQAGVALTLKAAEPLPPISGDPDQLTQVLNNLIENAINYGSSGGRVEVELSRLPWDARIKSEGILLAVIDHGEGIPEVHLPRLTERFYRVDDHRARPKGGTGLGLAIVKHIIHRHRGRMNVISTLGQGSRFEVLLPRS